MANFDLNDDDFFNTKTIRKKEQPKKSSKETKKEEPKTKEEPVNTKTSISNLFSDDESYRPERANFTISNEELAFIRCVAFRMDFKRPVTDFCRAAIRAYIKNLKKDKDVYNSIIEDFNNKISK